MLSVNKAVPSVCRAETCSLLSAAWSTKAAGTVAATLKAGAEQNPQQRKPCRDAKEVETAGSPSEGARVCGHPAKLSSWGPGMVVVLLWPHLAQNNFGKTPQSTWQIGRTCRYFLSKPTSAVSAKINRQPAKAVGVCITSEAKQ